MPRIFRNITLGLFFAFAVTASAKDKACVSVVLETSVISETIVPQKNRYYCAPASMESELVDRGFDIDQTEIGARVRPSTVTGTKGVRIVEEFQRHGLEAELKTDVTIAELKRLKRKQGGALLNVTLDGVPHWVRLMDFPESNKVRLMDPWFEAGEPFDFTVISVNKLLRIWKGGEGRHAAVLIHTPNESP